MRRALSITGWILFGLLTLLAVVLFVVTKTPVGVKLVERFGQGAIESAVEDQLGSEVTWSELTGVLADRIIIRDLELRQDGEVWAKVERFALEWNLFDLIAGEVDIDQVVLADAALYRLPDIPEQPDQPQEEGGDFSLPDIRLAGFYITDFVLGEEVLGERYTVSLQGSARYLGSRLNVELRGATQEDTDELMIEARYAREEIDLEVSVLSTETGVLSNLIGAEGRTEIRARATGPLDELEARLLAGVGQYGEAEGMIYGSVEDADRLRIDLVFRPGPILPQNALDALGEEVVLAAQGTYRDEAADLVIEELSGAFGSISGEAAADLSGRLEASADLTGELNAAVLEPYGAEALAGAFGLDVTAQEMRGGGYAFSGRADAGSVSLQIEEGEYTEDVPFSGALALSARGVELGDDRIDPLLAEGVNVQGSVTYRADGSVSAEDIVARAGTTVGRRVILTGRADVGTQEQTVDASLRLQAGPQALALLTEDATFKSPVTVVADVAGTFEALSIDGSADLPGGTLSGQAFSAGRLVADVEGIPSRPSGTVRLVSAEDSYDGLARFNFEGNQLVVEELDVTASGLELDGSGRFNVETQAGQANLTFRAEQGTRIITGQTVGGNVELTAQIGAGLDPVSIDLSADSLRFDEQEIGRLRLEASGPRSAIAYDLTARDVTAGPVFLTEARSTGSLDLGEDQSAAIETLLLSLPGDESDVIRLAEPTRVSWGETIRLAPTVIDYLQDGVLRLEAELGSDRWQAQLSGSDVPLPQADALAGFEVSLDTARERPADFDLTVQSSVDDNVYALVTDGIWNGSSIEADSRLTRNQDEVLGTIDASVPLQLVREPSIGIELPEEGLLVEVQYQDRIAPLYAFLPIDGQPVTGRLNADVTVRGALAAPLAEGSIMLEDGRFEETTVGLTLTQLNGGVTFDVGPEGTVGRVDITGSGAAGRQNAVRLFGDVSTAGEQSRIALNLDLDQAQLARSAELEVRVTSELDLTGTFEELTLSGPIRLDELDLAIPDIEGDDAPSYAPVNVVRTDGPEIERAGEVEEAAESPVTINLDLSVRAQNGIFIRGRGLESEWNADLQVTGTVDDPRIAGSIGLEEGELNLAGRSFELTEGTIGFRRSDSLNPIINLEAQTEVGEASDAVTAIVSVEGPADDPTISFRSNPTLPEEDVLALLLFGRPAANLGASEALQLAQAAATLTGTGPFGGSGGVGASIRSGLGLDRLSFDPAGRSLTVGKYLSDDVYVSARQGIGDIGTVISVVYELSRFFSIETTLQPTGAQTLGANYKRDY